MPVFCRHVGERLGWDDAGTDQLQGIQTSADAGTIEHFVVWAHRIPFERELQELRVTQSGVIGSLLSRPQCTMSKRVPSKAAYTPRCQTCVLLRAVPSGQPDALGVKGVHIDDHLVRMNRLINMPLAGPVELLGSPATQ